MLTERMINHAKFEDFAKCTFTHNDECQEFATFSSEFTCKPTSLPLTLTLEQTDDSITTEHVINNLDKIAKTIVSYIEKVWNCKNYFKLSFCL